MCVVSRGKGKFCIRSSMRGTARSVQGRSAKAAHRRSWWRLEGGTARCCSRGRRCSWAAAAWPEPPLAMEGTTQGLGTPNLPFDVLPVSLATVHRAGGCPFGCRCQMELVPTAVCCCVCQRHAAAAAAVALASSAAAAVAAARAAGGGCRAPAAGPAAPTAAVANAASICPQGHRLAEG